MEPATLQGRVDQTWRLWHSSNRNRTEVGALLPDLIRDAEAAARTLHGADRRAALVALSDVYRLTGQATAYVAPAELAWVVADRASAAAQQADQPAAIAAAAWNMGNILRETSYPEEALGVVVEAADLIRPHLQSAPEDWRGVYGALQLHAAVTHAREGNEGDAWRFWDKGNQVAKSLPASYVHPSTVFGRANVDFHEISVATDLRKAQHALGLADEIDPDVMPSRERRARLWVEVARGHLQRGDRTAALHVMKLAHDIGAETVTYTPTAVAWPQTCGARLPVRFVVRPLSSLRQSALRRSGRGGRGRYQGQFVPLPHQQRSYGDGSLTARLPIGGSYGQHHAVARLASLRGIDDHRQRHRRNPRAAVS
ncbi:XRE family transcriptional regulator [Streptomyces sp. OE57]|uniref:XRE family transcriptional regulator n=1 Tax=Streptomyces lacaronensis TaxID=3379885 RepID=UPI0039B73261